MLVGVKFYFYLVFILRTFFVLTPVLSLRTTIFFHVFSVTFCKFWFSGRVVLLKVGRQWQLSRYITLFIDTLNDYLNLPNLNITGLLVKFSSYYLALLSVVFFIGSGNCGLDCFYYPVLGNPFLLSYLAN